MDTQKTKEAPRAGAIAELNDEWHANQIGYVITDAFSELNPMVISHVQACVQDFSGLDFTGDHPEHDFGALTVQGYDVCWKIDYFTEDLSKPGDPLDPECRRILTIMLAEEY